MLAKNVLSHVVLAFAHGTGEFRNRERHCRSPSNCKYLSFTYVIYNTWPNLANCAGRAHDRNDRAITTCEHELPFWRGRCWLASHFSKGGYEPASYRMALQGLRLLSASVSVSISPHSGPFFCPIGRSAATGPESDANPVCKKQTLVFASRSLDPERDDFHVRYMSNKIQGRGFFNKS